MFCSRPLDTSTPYFSKQNLVSVVMTTSESFEFALFTLRNDLNSLKALSIYSGPEVLVVCLDDEPQKAWPGFMQPPEGGVPTLVKYNNDPSKHLYKRGTACLLQLQKLHDRAIAIRNEYAPLAETLPLDTPMLTSVIDVRKPSLDGHGSVLKSKLHESPHEDFVVGQSATLRLALQTPLINVDIPAPPLSISSDAQQIDVDLSPGPDPTFQDLYIDGKKVDASHEQVSAIVHLTVDAYKQGVIDALEDGPELEFITVTTAPDAVCSVSKVPLIELKPVIATDVQEPISSTATTALYDTSAPSESQEVVPTNTVVVTAKRGRGGKRGGAKSMTSTTARRGGRKSTSVASNEEPIVLTSSSSSTCSIDESTGEPV